MLSAKCQVLVQIMADERQQAGGVVAAATSTNTVRVTFLPEGQVVEFERGRLAYQDHGKPE